LASIGSKRSSIVVPASIPASTGSPSPDGPAKELDPAGRRQEAVLGFLA
jgi:hypothetical protein